MKYSELARQYFEAPACAGVLVGPGCFRGAAGSRAQGTWVQFDVQVGSRDGAGRVQAARFLAFGCPHVIAASELIAEEAAGRAVEGGLPRSVQSLRERLEVPIEKLGRLLVVEDAWLAVMRAAARGAH